MTDAPSCGLIDGFSIGSVSSLFRDENFRFVMRYIEAFSISLSFSLSLSLSLFVSSFFKVLPLRSFGSTSVRLDTSRNFFGLSEAIARDGSTRSAIT